MQIKWVSAKTLKPHPKNNNKHTPDQIERLAKIIRYQGQRTPVVVSNRSGFLVKGHATLEAIKLNGTDSVAVIEQNFEDDTQEYAYMTADNAIAAWSEIDLSAVKYEVPELGEFDHDLLGFKEFELFLSQQISEINRGDENSEWVGMPEFVVGDKEIKITLVFKTELERDQYAEEHGLSPTSKRDNQWLCRL